MKRSFFVHLSVWLVLAGASAVSAAGPSAEFSDLAWMAGHYEGSLGQGSLEENWAEPKGGSIASLVRATGADGSTSMIELIVVEEEEGSLTVRLKQRDPGLKPRAAEPQVMRLVAAMAGKVVFENIGEGGIRRLGYIKSGKKFTISVIPANGKQRDIELSAK